MIFRYGTYAHATDEAEVSISRTPKRGSSGRVESIVVEVGVRGKLVASSNADLLAAIAALESGYESDGGDISLAYNDGTIAWRLLSGDTVGGVRVTRSPSYPTGTGAEYAGQRSYELSLTGEIPAGATLSGGSYVDFSESVQYAGGGPVYVVLDCLDDPPVRQMTQRYSAYRAAQSGRAVGRFPYPVAPRPLWPEALVRDGEFTRTPRRSGSVTLYEITWSYTFASPTPLVGYPNEWR